MIARTIRLLRITGIPLVAADVAAAMIDGDLAAFNGHSEHAYSTVLV